tara:strand:+ start:19640 stop:20437 length:798 start_codon:yes stop_codon:yes gene_type:complete
MMPTSSLARPRHSKNELGRFLRSRREGIKPETLGLPAGGRRRTPGLRRDEVAERAGISVDWYIRLEQGRPVNPSRQTVEAIAAALHLDPVETHHLHALTGMAPPPGEADGTVPSGVGRMIACLNQPAYVTSRLGDVLDWNGPADEIFSFSAVPAPDRNVLAGMFLRPAARKLFGQGWEAEARRMIAEFRPVHDVNAADPRFRLLASRLKTESADFARWWDLHDIKKGGAGQKTLSLPDGRQAKFEYVALQVLENPALKVAIYYSA